jgi:hypothetical protein
MPVNRCIIMEYDVYHLIRTVKKLMINIIFVFFLNSKLKISLNVWDGQ